ncbi:MAG: TolB family protein [Bacteroidota bacterium]
MNFVYKLRAQAFPLSLVLLLSCSLDPSVHRSGRIDPDSLRSPGEHHLSKITQLTFGGENAEAYFSFDDTRLVFQSTRDSFRCDQIYTMKLDGSDVRLLSTGKGRTTCAYFYPDGMRVLYSSTHLAGSECLAPPDRSRGYVWALYKSFDIFLADLSGNILQQLTFAEGYDAEATISPRGDKIVFTSMRDGDLELYSMDLDGSNIQRLTRTRGYDGGAFYSFDGRKIVYRAFHPTSEEAVRVYEELLKDGLIRPTRLEIFVMDADGRNIIQVTDNGAANFAPFFHPDGQRIIFSSNMNDPKRRNFDLFIIKTSGTDLEQVTFNETFDSFPMFSRDGKKLVFASNRNARKHGETNIFIADWDE